jgi:heptose-I-phosphate ethanolaminephosphotransferase
MFYIPNALWSFHNHIGGSAFRFNDLIAANIFSTIPYLAFSLLLLSIMPGIIATIIIAMSAYGISFLSWLGIAHFIIYGHRINGGSLYIALNSNISEISEFISMYGNTKVFAYFFGIIMAETLLIISLQRHRDDYRNCRKLGFVLGILLIPFAFLALTGKASEANNDNLIFVYSDALWNYRLDEMKMIKLRKKAENRKIIITGRVNINKDTKETYVLVLGESISRRHMSLYGYQRNTNPFLSSLSNEIYVFDDVVSAEMYTVASLQKILTFANHEDMSPLYQSNLIAIMKTAGFKTFWISNQTAFGPGEPWSKYLSESADERFFLNAHGSSFDEKILAPFSKIVNDKEPKKFIVVHLMGAHVNAKKRYPPSFEHFTRESNADWIRKNKRSPRVYDYIDSYDNAIRYEDHVIYEIINTLKANNGIRMMLYVPDHGEEVGEVDDFIGRCFRTTRYMFEIPFIAWMSPEYFSSRINMAKRMKMAIHRPFQTDSFIHSFMDFAGIWTDQFVPERSIINDHFKGRKRYLGGKDYNTVVLHGEKKANGPILDLTFERE